MESSRSGVSSSQVLQNVQEVDSFKPGVKERGRDGCKETDGGYLTRARWDASEDGWLAWDERNESRIHSKDALSHHAILLYFK